MSNKAGLDSVSAPSPWSGVGSLILTFLWILVSRFSFSRHITLSETLLVELVSTPVQNHTWYCHISLVSFNLEQFFSLSLTGKTSFEKHWHLRSLTVFCKMCLDLGFFVGFRLFIFFSIYNSQLICIFLIVSWWYSFEHLRKILSIRLLMGMCQKIQSLKGLPLVRFGTVWGSK